GKPDLVAHEPLGIVAQAPHEVRDSDVGIDRHSVHRHTSSFSLSPVQGARSVPAYEAPRFVRESCCSTGATRTRLATPVPIDRVARPTRRAIGPSNGSRESTSMLRPGVIPSSAR